MAITPTSAPESLAPHILKAFTESLVDKLTQIGIDAVRPAIRQAAVESVAQLQARIASGPDYEAMEMRQVIKLIIDGKAP